MLLQNLATRICPFISTPLANAKALRFKPLRCPSFCLFVCPFIRLSPVESVKSFATRQHMTANGGRILWSPIHLLNK